jgi:hypothetical protein
MNFMIGILKRRPFQGNWIDLHQKTGWNPGSKENGC